MSTGRRISTAVGLLAPALLTACVTPYIPARIELRQPPPTDLAERVLGVLRHQGYRVGRYDPDPLRVQSKWSDHQRGDVPGWKRATVFVSEVSKLGIVVEVRYLNIGLFGDPYQTQVTTDPALEQELSDALRDALQ